MRSFNAAAALVSICWDRSLRDEIRPAEQLVQLHKEQVDAVLGALKTLTDRDRRRSFRLHRRLVGHRSLR